LFARDLFVYTVERILKSSTWFCFVIWKISWMVPSYYGDENLPFASKTWQHFL